MSALAVGLTAAILMEPIAALLHRFVMHRQGWTWHRSHHGSRRGLFEANDLFPVLFAAITIVAMAIGATFEGWQPLLWAGAGVAAYGAAYVAVHDICIHGRFGRPLGGNAYLRRVRDAHELHHRFGRGPYGFLVPVVPVELRARMERRPASCGRRNENATVDSLRTVDTLARRSNTS